MAYTVDRVIEATGSVGAVSRVRTAFQRLNTDEKLGLLWSLYTNMGQAITPAAPGAARMQFAAGLLEQVRAMAAEEQLQFMRDLINERNTPETRAYGVLSSNTKLAFWYQLAQWMDDGSVIPVPASYRLSGAAVDAFGAIAALDFGQQITLLRQIVVGMGVDPLAF